MAEHVGHLAVHEGGDPVRVVHPDSVGRGLHDAPVALLARPLVETLTLGLCGQGEHLLAPALFLDSDGVEDGLAHVLRKEREERPGLLVERAARVDARDHEQARSRCAGADQRQHDGGRQGLRKRAGVKLAEPARQVVDGQTGARALGGSERPRRVVVQRHDRRRRPRMSREAGGRDEATLAAGVVDAVE